MQFKNQKKELIKYVEEKQQPKPLRLIKPNNLQSSSSEEEMPREKTCQEISERHAQCTFKCQNFKNVPLLQKSKALQSKIQSKESTQTWKNHQMYCQNIIMHTNEKIKETKDNPLKDLQENQEKTFNQSSYSKLEQLRLH